MVDLNRKVTNISYFNLRIMHSLAMSMCLLQKKMLGLDAEKERNYKEIFKFLADEWIGFTT